MVNCLKIGQKGLLKMKLYEISRDIEDVFTMAETYAKENDGEIHESFVDCMDSLQLEYNEKVENIGCYIKNLNAACNEIKIEEKSLEERRKSKERKIEWLKGYLSSFVKEKFETSKVKISFRSSTSVVVNNPDLLDDINCNIKIIRTPDKIYIREKLESGVDVPDCSLVKTRHIQIK